MNFYFLLKIYSHSESIVTVQRHFRQKFHVALRDAISDRNTTQIWVQPYRITGCVMKRKPPGLSCSVRTLKVIDTVRKAIPASPRSSARRQALAFGMSCRSLHSILQVK